jgi:nucleotide-binding universal stress UspA family protein
MPHMTEDELKQMVEAGKIVGFTLDTTEFHHAGYNFQSKILKALGQFSHTNVTLLFSEVVLNEVHAHISDELKAKSEQLRSALRQVAKSAAITLDPVKTMQDAGIPENASARAAELIDAFLAAIGALRLTVDDGPTVRQLHDLYFGSNPPFSAKVDKKSEFPDAIALLSLQHWAEKQDGFVLAVSNDGDWGRFAKESPRVIVLSALAPALNLFNKDDAFVAARLAANLAAGSALSLRASIDAALDDAVEVFELEASAPYYYETDDECASINGWEVAEPRFDVVSSDAEFVTLAFPLAVKATFEASFSFTMRDGIDKDYIGIGAAQASTTETFDSQVLVTIARDDENSDPEVVELEIDMPTLSVDFGYVEVDYGDDRDEKW